ncbi:MAG: hypothetical protein AB1603_02290 [Chloroflexota bacterium]
MQTYVQYRVCEGPLPSIGTLRHFSSENGPTCFLLAQYSAQRMPAVDADDLLAFLETFGDTADKLQVLFFWSKHLKTKCTVDCISPTPDCRHLDPRRAVRELVHQGVLEESSDGWVTWYSLTTDEEKRRSVENLARLTWDRLRFWNDYRIVELTQGQASS